VGKRNKILGEKHNSLDLLSYFAAFTSRRLSYVMWLIMFYIESGRDYGIHLVRATICG